uniref:Uncharacterized protein n=1 Tax=Cacopsylla melanoneura TaxID=428564 RepID=A0A8D9F0R7_9HEMI
METSQKQKLVMPCLQHLLFFVIPKMLYLCMHCYMHAYNIYSMPSANIHHNRISTFRIYNYVSACRNIKINGLYLENGVMNNFIRTLNIEEKIINLKILKQHV